jgi:hypothetical protein
MEAKPMTADQIAGVLGGLTPDDYRWYVTLPESACLLLGQRVGLEIYTRSSPSEGPPPDLTPAEVALVTMILAGLPGVLAEAERRYREHEATYPDACGGVYAPWISISREELAECGRWAVVLKSQDGPPDWNIHIEFEGTTFRWIGQAGE